MDPLQSDLFLVDALGYIPELDEAPSSSELDDSDSEPDSSTLNPDVHSNNDASDSDGSVLSDPDSTPDPTVPLVGGQFRPTHKRDRSKWRVPPKKCSAEHLNNYLYRDGGCCRGKRTDCHTLNAFTHADIVKRRSLVCIGPQMSLSCQPAVILSIINCQRRKTRQDGRVIVTNYVVDDIPLCQKAFCELFNISRWSFLILYIKFTISLPL